MSKTINLNIPRTAAERIRVPWKCSGCGAISVDRERTCDCPTEYLFRGVPGKTFEHAWKETDILSRARKYLDANAAESGADDLIRELMLEIKRLPLRPDIKNVVDEQAGDPGLWFVPTTVTEDYLQRALRRLHAVIEGKTPEECAIETLTAPE